MKKIAIIGGTQKQTFVDIAKKSKVKVLFHDAKLVSRQSISQLDSIIRNADCVVIMKGACSHNGMYKAKSLAKKYGKIIVYHQGRGATGGISLGVKSTQVI